MQLSDVLIKILDSSEQQIAFIDADLTIRYANAPFSVSHNRTPESIQGIHLRGLYDENDVQAIAHNIAKAANGNVTNHCFSWERNGDRNPVLVRVIPNMNELGTVEGAFVYISNDATPKTSSVSMQHCRQDPFLMLLSHELRNPVAAIQLSVDMLEQACDSQTKLLPNHRTAINIIKRQSALIIRLIEDVLKRNDAERTQLGFEKKPICFPELVQEMLHATTAITQKKNQTVKFTSEVTSGVIEGDSVRLTQAMTNLIDNASKFSPQNSEIEIDCYFEDGQIVTRVSDRGPGIDSTEHQKIFDLNFQSSQRPHKTTEGYGIGLYWVKQIADAHRGTINVTSPGRLGGCDFELRLPVCKTSHEQLDDTIPSAPGRLAIVEDNEDARLALAIALKSRGFQITTFGDGQCAIDEIPSLAPDTVLIDISLPGKDGLSVVRELQQHTQLQKTLFVAITGHSQQREMILKAGFDEHMVKPVDTNQLCRIISQHNQK
jgi:CheY-like chemotaxis protein/nitrogen-specific signal transduction histidine kinase